MIISNSKVRRQNSNQFGRVGGFFKMPGTNDIYGISNNHVIANLNNADVGDTICDSDNNPIGLLSDWILLTANGTNKTEFALFKLNEPATLQWTAWNNFKNNPPQGFKAPEKGVAIFYPQGDKTSQGTIENINASVQLDIAGNTYNFINCIKIIDNNEAHFSDHGDSGGGVFSVDNNLIGIIVAIKDDGSASYAVPFVNGILNYYDLQIH